MDITVITQLISSIGFPIVACWYLANNINKTLDNNTKAINELTKVVSILADKTGVSTTNE